MTDRSMSLGASWRVTNRGASPTGRDLDLFLAGLRGEITLGTEDVLGLLDPILFVTGPMGWPSLDRRAVGDSKLLQVETPWFRDDEWRKAHLAAWRARYVNRLPYSAVSSALGCTRRAALGRVQKVNSYLLRVEQLTDVKYSFRNDPHPEVMERIRIDIEQMREMDKNPTVFDIMDLYNTSPTHALYLLKKDWIEAPDGAQRPRGKLTDEEVERLVTGDLSGLGYRSAGKVLGVSGHTVQYHRRKAEETRAREPVWDRGNRDYQKPPLQFRKKKGAVSAE